LGSRFAISLHREDRIQETAWAGDKSLRATEPQRTAGRSA
jgi:hypothetical protein